MEAQNDLNTAQKSEGNKMDELMDLILSVCTTKGEVVSFLTELAQRLSKEKGLKGRGEA